MSSKIKKYTSPFPTSSEILRTIAKHLGTKTKKFDDYARKGHHSEEDHRTLIKQAFTGPIQTSSYKLKKRTDEYLNQFFRQYHGYVAQTWVGGLERTDLDQPLLDIFTVFGLGAVNFLTHSLKIPDYNEWFSEDMILPHTFRWLEQTNTSFKDAVQGLDLERKNSIRKWRSGKHIPSFSLIQSLVTELRASGLSTEDCEHVFTLLIIARTVDSFLKEDKTGKLLKTLRSQIQKRGDRCIDIWGIQRHDQKSLALANDMARRAEAILDLDPTPIDQEKLNYIRHYLDAAWDKHTAEKHKETLVFIIHRVEAKYATIIGDEKSALKHYKKAFQYSLYTAGSEHIKIIHEALAVAAQCDDRVFLKKLKSQAIAFGMLNYFEAEQPNQLIGNQQSRSKDYFVEDWEVDQWKETFPHLFPKSLWTIAEHSPFIITKTNLTPDPRQPNRERQISDGRPKKMPDTVLFSEWNDKEAVKKLLEAGADVSQLSKAGESALSMAIQECNPTLISLTSGDDELFNLIYERALTTRSTSNPDCLIKTMINTPTVKRKLTPLGCAVETGRVDMVKKILDLGAEPDQRFGLEQVTPLYHCIGLMNRASDPERLRSSFANYVESAPIEIQRETIRRYTGAIPSQDMTPRHQIIQEALMKIMIERYQEVSRDDLRSIAKLLLDYGASPNIRCSNGMVSDFTPLMLAIEIDDVELVRLMTSEYKGDATLSCYSHTNNEFYNGKEIAWNWGSKRVLETMNCIPFEHVKQ